nr:PREDICTED: ADAMTS-like protein 1 isoform X2 [Equus przewalskii]
MECCRRATPGTPLLFLAFLLLSSRTARSEEDRDGLWDAWGPWSECSRTCGGGASYSLRRCLSSKFRHPSSIQSPNTLRKAQRL